MIDIARYIEASFAKTGTAAAAKVKGRANSCCQCNYSNNYYGDQVCLKQPK